MCSVGAAPSSLSVRHPSRTSKRSAHWDSLTTSAKTQMDKDSLLASFSAGRVPPISIEKYLLQIDRVVHIPNAVLLAMLVYLDRMAQWSTKLNLSSDSRKAFVVNSFTVHRLVLAGILAATKYHSDVTYTVACYARVSILFSVSCGCSSALTPLFVVWRSEQSGSETTGVGVLASQ